MRPHGKSAANILAGMHGSGISQTWSINQSGRTIEKLCWDDLVGGCARFLINGSAWPLRWRDWNRGLQAIWELSITPVRLDDYSRYFTLESDGRFLPALTSDEALAFIAASTLSLGKTQLFGGLKPYEHYSSCYPDREISGHLTFLSRTLNRDGERGAEDCRVVDHGETTAKAQAHGR